MGLRIQAFLLALGLACFSSLASALGLGEISIHSTLNQPLDAEVELLQVRSLTDEELVVGLATNEAFEQAGVDRTSFMLDLKFTLDLANPNGARVKITSTKPVREPFLNFIVQARWPSGRLLREYTLLVDLPVFSGSKAAAVATPSQTTPRSSSSAQNATSRPAASRTTSTRPAVTQRPSTQSFDGETYGPVSSNDTLWNIAAKVRPNSDVSVQQTMIAIQRLNPNAFIRNNINLLRRGQVLRVPSYEDITELSTREAIREVANQNRAWNNQDTDFEDDGAPLEGSSTYAATRTDQSQPEGRLKLSSREDGFSATDSGRGEGEEGGRAALETALSIAQEEVDATRRENSELREKLLAMEEQVKTMEKLLEVSSEEMRALELTTAAIDQEADSAANDSEASLTEDDVAGEEIVDPAGLDSEDASAEASSEADEASAQAAAEPEESSASAVEPPAAQPEPKKSLVETIIDLVMSNLLYVGIGAGALVLAIVAFIFMRNRDDGFDDEFEDFEPNFSASDEAPFEQGGFDGGAEDQEGDTVVAGFDAADEDLSRNDNIPAEAETEDVVAECDIHIAYGQYDQAEEKLLRSLEKDSGNDEVRLKLLEVYAAQNNSDDFDRHYAKLRVFGAADAVTRAESLRGSIDGAGVFDESLLDSVSEDDTVVAEPSLISEESASEQELGNDTLDFSLDSELGVDETDDTTVVATTDDTASELSLEPTAAEELEFSLDLDDEDDKTVVKSESSGSADEFSTDDAVDLDFDVSEPLADAELEGELGDIEFDLDDADIDLDFDGVELELDDSGLEAPELSFDSELEEGAEPLSLSEEVPSEALSLTGELDEDATQVRGLEPETLSLEDQEPPSIAGSETDVSEFDLSLDDDDDVTQLRSDEAVTPSADEFDFDADLDAALEQEDSADKGSLADSFVKEEESADLDLGEPEALETDASTTMEEPDLSFDGLSLEDEDAPTLEDTSLEEPASKLSDKPEDVFEGVEPAAETPATEKDFDTDMDLDSDFNLDELDQELSELESGFSGDTSELDEPSSETLDSVADTLESAQESESKKADNSEASVPFSGEAIEKAADTKLELGDQSLDAAISSMDFEIPDFDPEEDDDSKLEFLSDSDETATKLDLARAYIDMGDADGAKDILDEIMEEGNDDQKKQAETLLTKMG